MGAEAVLAPKGGDFPKTFPPKKKSGGNMYISVFVRFRVNPNEVTLAETRKVFFV